MSTDPKRDFWDARGAQEAHPGTNDFILKRLEVEMLVRSIARRSRVLDVGCGDGETLLALAERNECTGVGVDFSNAMIEAADRRQLSARAEARIEFRQGALPDLPPDLGTFDYVITERCLINLSSADQQHDAFKALMRHVRPNGQYLMVESFKQGMDRTNEMRTSLGLPPIEPPWHNVFLDEAIVSGWATAEFENLERVPFTSTYHFLSRVVYAKLATDSGEEMRYDSEINVLALKLPAFGDCGPVRLWRWRRAAASNA